MKEEHIHGRQPRSVRVRLGLTSAATSPPVDSSKLANMTRALSSSERAQRGVRFALPKLFEAAGLELASAKILVHISKVSRTETYWLSSLIAYDFSCGTARSDRSILCYMTSQQTLDIGFRIRRVRLNDKGIVATKVKCSIHRALLKIRDLVNLVPSIKYMCCKCGFRGRDLSTGSFALVSSKSGNCRGMQEA